MVNGGAKTDIWALFSFTLQLRSTDCPRWSSESLPVCLKYTHRKHRWRKKQGCKQKKTCYRQKLNFGATWLRAGEEQFLTRQPSACWMHANWQTEKGGWLTAGRHSSKQGNTREYGNGKIVHEKYHATGRSRFSYRHYRQYCHGVWIRPNELCSCGGFR